MSLLADPPDRPPPAEQDFLVDLCVLSSGLREWIGALTDPKVFLAAGGVRLARTNPELITRFCRRIVHSPKVTPGISMAQPIIWRLSA